MTLKIETKEDVIRQLTELAEKYEELLKQGSTGRMDSEAMDGIVKRIQALEDRAEILQAVAKREAPGDETPPEDKTVGEDEEDWFK